MESIRITLLTIFAGLVFIPPLARRLGLPVIVAELIYGIVLGVSFLNLIPREEQVIEFFSCFGLVYLMFVVGLETDFGAIYREGYLKQAVAVASASLLLPFAAGAAISYMVDVHPMLMGTIFCTTSIGLILPLLKDVSCSRKFSQTLVGSVVFVDIISIFLLAFVLAGTEGSIGAEFFYGLLAMLILLLLPWILSRKGFHKKVKARVVKEGHFDIEIRIAFAVIFSLAAASSFLGFHAIIGAFIAGLIVSEIIPSHARQHLQSFGYGFFIPLLFILIGAEVNLPLLFSSANNIAILAVIVVVALLSKACSVTVANRLIGFSRMESLASGIFHGARLSLIIAVAEVSRGLDLIGENLFSSLVILAIISAIVAPAIGKRILSRA